MVSLAWNYQGYVFQEGVHVLRAAYRSAADALHEEWERARENAVAYRDGVESGRTEWIGEREDGHVLWDQEQILEMEIESKFEGQGALRKAFALAAYHHWERGARSWTGSDARDHEKLAKAVRALGIGISPHLEAVKDLANLLKHDNDKRGADLLKSWPQLLPPPSSAQGATRTDWYGAVRLTDAHLDEALDAVAASGPDAQTVYACGA
jgi:hypothetical protein